MMRLMLVATAFAVFAPRAVTAADPEKPNVEFELRSSSLAPGLTLAESGKGVYALRLTAQVNKQGEGKGTLVLESNAPVFDEFGTATTAGNLPPVKLECSLKFVKKGRVQVLVGPPPQEWLLFEITGPKITSRLFLATPAAPMKYGRLLVQDKDGKVKYAVEVIEPGPPLPCHPGCFPAGTAVRVPGGTKPIERVREGDLVTTIGPEGTSSQSKVTSVFITRNRLMEVRTDDGNLVTTETQPLCLAGGGFRAAGELQAGDRIWRWESGERQAVTVRSVSPTGREERVFNLIVGDLAIFVANDFLARSKPPAPASPAPAEGRP